VPRRPKDRSPTVEDDQDVAALATGRIELEVHVQAPGQTAKLAQQLIAVHRHCIAGDGAAVKIGDPRCPRNPVGG
jgi:hypothetical protein